MPKDLLFLVTKVDPLKGETETLCREEDREIATATFQAACMDPNATAPTPLLLEMQKKATDGTFSLTLLNATVLFPGSSIEDWKRERGLEGQYKILFDNLKDLHRVLEGYTSFGEETLNEASPADEE